VEGSQSGNQGGQVSGRSQGTDAEVFCHVGRSLRPHGLTADDYTREPYTLASFRFLTKMPKTLHSQTNNSLASVFSGEAM
jgi:hypothetical protein